MNTTPHEASVTLAGPVTREGSAKFVDTVEAHAHAGVERETIVVTSEGGDAEAGLELYESIRGADLPHVTTHAPGEVSSIANVVYLAGDRRTATPAAEFFLHRPFLGDMNDPGSAESLATLSIRRAQAERANASGTTLAVLDLKIAYLRTLERDIQEVVADRTSMSRTEVAVLMGDEKTLDANEALAAGIVHEIIGDSA